MKDAQGHGSDSRGGGEQHVMDIAAQHGIQTSHLMTGAGADDLAQAIRQLANREPPGDYQSGWSDADLRGVRNE